MQSITATATSEQSITTPNKRSRPHSACVVHLPYIRSAVHSGADRRDRERECEHKSEREHERERECECERE